MALLFFFHEKMNAYIYVECVQMTPVQTVMFQCSMKRDA